MKKRDDDRTAKSQNHQRSSVAKYTHVEPSSHATDVTGCVRYLENSKLEGRSVDRRVRMSEVQITDIPLYMYQNA